MDLISINEFQLQTVDIVRRPEDLFKQVIPEFKFFTELDVKSAFFQIPIGERDSKICASVTPNGSYSLQRLSERAKDSSATLERIVRNDIVDKFELELKSLGFRRKYMLDVFRDIFLR